MAGKAIYMVGIICVFVAAIIINFYWDFLASGSYTIGNMDARMGCLPILSSFAGCGAIALVNVFFGITFLALIMFAFWG